MGAVLALDFGTKRIGLAVTDAERRFIFPRDTLERSTPETDFGALRDRAVEDRVDLVVVGLPLNADGTEGGMSRAARLFGDALGSFVGLPVKYVDERYTTLEADEQLRVRFPKDTRKRRSLRDRAAATIILRTFLDHGAVG